MTERQPPRNGRPPGAEPAGRTRYRLRVPGRLEQAALDELRDCVMERAVDWLRETVACVVPEHPSVRIRTTQTDDGRDGPLIEMTVTVDETLAESHFTELPEELTRGFSEGLILTDVDPEDIDVREV